MLKEHSGFLERLVEFTDLAIVVLSFFFTFQFYLYRGLQVNFTPQVYLGLQALTLMVWWVLINMFARGYSRRTVSVPLEIWALIKVHIIGISVILICLIFYNPEVLNNRFMLYFTAINFGLMLLQRLGIRVFLNNLRFMGYNYRNVLIVGWNSKASAYVERIESSPHLGYRLLGYINDLEAVEAKLPYLGPVEGLEELVKTKVIDQVLITLPFADSRVENCVEVLEQMGKNTSIVLNDTTEHLVSSQVVNFQGLAMLNYSSAPPDIVQLALKRMLDILSSLAGIMLLSPVFLVTAMAIKFSSKGPVLFKQPRVGLNGRIFNCYKFRSMVVDAEQLKQKLMHLNEMSGPVFKIKDDPRVTTVGRFIRKTSIDELPQLFNVLFGDMSLVGPRPPLQNEVRQYQNIHRKRLSVKPGITCIWQVSGRNEVDFEQWMEMDNEYIHNWSLWLDIKLIFQTIPVVLFRKGAS